MDPVTAAIKHQLHTANFVLLDRFLSPDRCQALRQRLAGAWTGGRMEQGALAGGVTGENLTYSMTQVRGDFVGWFDGKESGFEALADYMKKADTCVSEVGEQEVQLGHISNRSQAMCAIYPGSGARYVKHTDNSCQMGEGVKCNGRRLTMILYLNKDWQQDQKKKRKAK